MTVAETIQTIKDIFEDITETMCSHYCKYPDIWDPEKEGIELADSDICKNCPLNRLG